MRDIIRRTCFQVGVAASLFGSSAAVAGDAIGMIDIEVPRSAEEMVEAGFKRYGVETGVITYMIAGNAVGEETLTFDQWGWREARQSEQTVRMMDQFLDDTRLDLLDGEKVTSVNLANREIRTGAVNHGTLSRPDMLVGKQVLLDLGGSHVGQKEVAGKICELYDVPSRGLTICVWNGVTLRSEARLLDLTVVMVATDIEVGKPVAATAFNVPKNVHPPPPEETTTLGSQVP